MLTLKRKRSGYSILCVHGRRTSICIGECEGILFAWKPPNTGKYLAIADTEQDMLAILARKYLDGELV